MRLRNVSREKAYPLDRPKLTCALQNAGTLFNRKPCGCITNYRVNKANTGCS